MKVLRVSGEDYAALTFEQTFGGESVTDLIKDFENTQKRWGQVDENYDLSLEEVNINQSGFQWTKKLLCDMDEESIRHDYVYGEGEIVGEGFVRVQYRVLKVGNDHRGAEEFSSHFDGTSVAKILDNIEEYRAKFVELAEDEHVMCYEMDEKFDLDEFELFHAQEVDVESRADCYYYIENETIYKCV